MKRVEPNCSNPSSRCSHLAGFAGPRAQHKAYKASPTASDKPDTPCKHCGETHWHNQCPQLQQPKPAAHSKPSQAGRQPPVGGHLAQAHPQPPQPSFADLLGLDAPPPSGLRAEASEIVDGGGYVWDSGATHHMVGDPSLLISFVAMQPVHVAGVNLEAVGVGTLVVDSFLHAGPQRLVLKHVLLVPGISRSLISHVQLMEAGFRCAPAVAHTSWYRSNMLVARAALDATSRLFLFPFVVLRQPAAHFATAKSVSLDDWHARFAHLAPEAILKLAASGDVFGLNLSKQQSSLQTCNDCSTCLAAKAHRASFPASASRAKAPLEIIHSDVLTLPEISSKGGKVLRHSP